MSERLRGPHQVRPGPGDRSAGRSPAKARRQRIIWGFVLLALVVAGAVVAATSEGSVLRSALAIILLGGAAVLAVALAFLEVGFSEDQERAGRFGRPSSDGDIPPDRERRSERFFKR